MQPVQAIRRARVLVADDTASIQTLFRDLLVNDGHDVVGAADGAEALEAVQRHHPDVVVLDVHMPKMDGFEVCRRLKSDPATRLTPVVLVTGFSNLSERLKGIEAGADDFLSKPVHPRELRARVGSLTRLKHLTDELDSAEAAFMALGLAIEARDPSMNGHAERMARHAVRIGQALGLPEEDLAALHRGGHLHDIGKLGIPDAILLKPGPLTADEFDVMKRHSEIGDRLCAPLQSLRRVRPIVLCHHERLDGSGYPNGLKGDQVPLLAQIIGVVDVFDALTSNRPYREAVSPRAAIRHLRDQVAQGLFAHDLVDLFAGLLGLSARQTMH